MLDVKQLTNDLVSNGRTPLALTIIGCVGVAATGVLAAKAGVNAGPVLDELQYHANKQEDPVDPTLKDKIAATWKLYIPAASVGVVTIVSIIGMNRINDRNVMLLTAGATLATNTLKDYQKHVLEEIGAEKESKIRDKIAKDTINHARPVPNDSNMFILGEGEVTCYDSLSGRYFKHSFEEIRAIENDLNRRMLQCMYIPLNDLYEALGLEPIQIGDVLGFNVDRMIEFHFSSQLSPQNKPVLVLGYINLPVANYMRIM